MSHLPCSGTAPTRRYTVLRPFAGHALSVVNRDNTRDTLAGSRLGASRLIADGGFRTVREITITEIESDRILKKIPSERIGDLTISHDTGAMFLVGPEGLESFEKPLLESQGYALSGLMANKSYGIRFETTAITALAGVLVEETGNPPLVVLEALRSKAAFALTKRNLNRIVIQAIETAATINHLVENEKRETWMSLRLNDIVTSLSAE